MKHALWKNKRKCTKIKMAVTKIVMAMTGTETLLKKNDFHKSRPFLISIRHCVIVIYSSTFGVYHLICFHFFTIVYFSFSFISAKFTRIDDGDVWATFWICYNMFDTIKIDELAVCVLEGETSNLACFFICVGLVGIIFGTPDTNSTMCSPLSNSYVSSPR